MPGKEYIPNTDAELIVWYENFTTKLPTYAAALGIAPAQVTQFTTDLTSVTQNVNTVVAAKTTLQSTVQQKESVISAALKRLRDTVVIMKRNTAYTQTIGEDLGVVPAVDGRLGPRVRDTAKPEFQAIILADKVRLDWVKGQFDGVVVQCKRGTESAFATLDKDTKSPYDDRRTNLAASAPETRIYRMRYLSGDEEVGLWSDEATVLCMI